MSKKPVTAHLPDVSQPINGYIAKKPQTLSVENQGGGTPLGNNVRVATTAEWDAQRDLIGVKNVVYVYTDHEQTEDGNPVPAFKVGDGLAYLIDAPFNSDIAMQHIQDTTVHVTAAEKEFWNNKVTAYLNAENMEQLILTKN